MQETIDKIQRDLSYSRDLLAAWADRAGQVLDQPIPNPGTLSLDAIEQELNQLETEVQVAEELLLNGYTSGQLHGRLSELQDEIAEAGQKTIAEWQADIARLETQLEQETPAWDTKEIREQVLVFDYDSQKLQDLVRKRGDAEREQGELEQQSAGLEARNVELIGQKRELRDELDKLTRKESWVEALAETKAMTNEIDNLLTRLKTKIHVDAGGSHSVP